MYTLYHNPRCGKSRTCLAHFESHGIAFQLKPYLKTGLTSTEVKGLMNKYDGPFMDLVRTNEAIWKEIAPDEPNIDTVAALIAQHPIVLQRPLVVTPTQTVIARPLDRIAQLGLSI